MHASLRGEYSGRNNKDLRQADTRPSSSQVQQQVRGCFLLLITGARPECGWQNARTHQRPSSSGPIDVRTTSLQNYYRLDPRWAPLHVGHFSWPTPNNIFSSILSLRFHLSYTDRLQYHSDTRRIFDNHFLPLPFPT